MIRTGNLWKNALVALFVLLAVGAYYWIGAQNAEMKPVFAPTPSPAFVEQSSPVQAFRERRDNARQQETNMLLALTSSETVSEGTRTLAEELLLTITRNAERELLLEGALAGMDLDAVCAVRDDAAVIMAQGELTERDAARIMTLACENAGVAPENVKILE